MDLDRGHAGPIGNFRKPWYRVCAKLGLGAMEPVIDPVTGKPVFERAIRAFQAETEDGIFRLDFPRSAQKLYYRRGTRGRSATRGYGHVRSQNRGRIQAVCHRQPRAATCGADSNRRLSCEKVWGQFRDN